MRNAFNQALTRLADQEPSVSLLVGDIGFKVFDQFRAEHPGRFLNLGVAEASLLGTAAGLAMEGKRPIVYTIIPFLVMRAFEQIRVDVCMHKLPVLLVGVGGGLSYDTLGPTHHAIEDVAIMRALPDMTVLTPSDPAEVEWMLPEVFARMNGPVYLRLGKGGEPVLHEDARVFQWAAPLQMREGADVVFISHGPILAEVLGAADILDTSGTGCAVYHFNQVKPLPAIECLDEFRHAKLVVTVEEHNVHGGLGEGLAAAWMPYALGVPMVNLGIRDRITTEVGKRDYLLAKHGLNADLIARQVAGILARQVK